MKRLLEYINNKKGFVIMEQILVSGFVFLMLFVGVSMFAYMGDANKYATELDNIGVIAKRNGGLSSSEIEEFEIKIRKLSNSDDVKLTVSSKNKEVNTDGYSYVSKRNNGIIDLELRVPIKPYVGYFLSNISKDYVIKTTVVSERY